MTLIYCSTHTQERLEFRKEPDDEEGMLYYVEPCPLCLNAREVAAREEESVDIRAEINQLFEEREHTLPLPGKDSYTPPRLV